MDGKNCGFPPPTTAAMCKWHADSGSNIEIRNADPFGSRNAMRLASCHGLRSLGPGKVNDEFFSYSGSASY